MAFAIGLGPYPGLTAAQRPTGRVKNLERYYPPHYERLPHHWRSWRGRQKVEIWEIRGDSSASLENSANSGMFLRFMEFHTVGAFYFASQCAIHSPAR